MRHARGRQQALLGKVAQEKFIQPRVGSLLDDLRPYEESLPYEHDDASLIRVARREYERLVRIPPEFTARYQPRISAKPTRSGRRRALPMTSRGVHALPGEELST